MSTNVNSFKLELTALKGLPAKLYGQAKRKIALTALDRVVKRTPVDTGRARGNWQTSAGPTNETEFVAKDPSGRGALAEGRATINAAPPFASITLFNNLPYIEYLENGGFVPTDPGPSKDPRKGRKGRVLVQGGFSVQAPKGMVGVTIAELGQIRSLEESAS